MLHRLSCCPAADFLRLATTAIIDINPPRIIDRIERTLQKVVLEELRRECGEEETGWWMTGVPKTVRVKVSQRFEEDEGKRGGKENYFDLIDYAKIAVENWDLFEPILSYEKTGKKEARIHWMNVVNDKRNIVSHPSAAVTLTLDDLALLEELRPLARWEGYAHSVCRIRDIDDFIALEPYSPVSPLACQASWSPRGKRATSRNG
jgi:hypothetical protein